MLQRGFLRAIKNLSFSQIYFLELCTYINNSPETFEGILHTGDTFLSGHISNSEPNHTNSHFAPHLDKFSQLNTATTRDLLMDPYITGTVYPPRKSAPQQIERRRPAKRIFRKVFIKDCRPLLAI